MAKAKKVKSSYVCQSCGHSAPKWLGRCPQCDEWNSLVEEVSRPAGRGIAARPTTAGAAANKPVSIAEALEADDLERLCCGIDELDRVLGSGLVPGSLVLLGGDPGVGKSTLLCQMLQGIAEAHGSILYASGEESVAQTGLRAKRVGATNPGLTLYAETNLDIILEQALEMRPAVLAIDSIQTVHCDALDSIPGSVGQVREATGRLMAFSKTSGIPTILVGHVTKEGSIAGPKTLEHMVDTVLHFEGEGTSPYRILRAIKNRFGSTQEIGVFEMRGSGLCEVPNPSELFLAERPEDAPGSLVVATLEGTRPILVEVQALVAPPAANFGRRTCAGVDSNRVALLLAVLAKRAGLDLVPEDVFVNVAGGVRVFEPAVDLGIACALASSAYDNAVDGKTLVFGEVGLAGEVRAVNMADIRLSEAAKLGFERCVLPEQNRQRLESDHGLTLVGVSTVKEALRALS
ncbi:MAG: DNA repair protein RadA [Myxococcales bacterium]|nr:DNA repair protein RadA [Myxococcales bacterium]